MLMAPHSGAETRNYLQAKAQEGSELAKRRLAEEGPRYPAADVEARFQKLEEISRRKNLGPAQVKELLRRMRAGEEV